MDSCPSSFVSRQVETLEAALEQERRRAAEKEARNKLNVDRLRRQITALQVGSSMHRHNLQIYVADSTIKTFVRQRVSCLYLSESVAATLSPRRLQCGPHPQSDKQMEC
jgi:hypothetical protein